MVTYSILMVSNDLMMSSLPAGLESLSQGRGWSRSESTVLAGAGVGTGAGKILPTPTPAWSRSHRLPPVKRRRFWPMVIHPPENIERQEEKESGNS